MRRLWRSLWQGCDGARAQSTDDPRVDWVRVLPFLGMHVGCLAVIWAGWSHFAVAFAVGAWFVRMFAITAFYHRYFSHRAFRTSRAAQFCFALLGASAVQRGPLWWAAHHRLHHRAADTPADPHSPRRGFWRSHVIWILESRNFRTRIEEVPDLARYPELRFLDRFDLIVPLAYAGFTFALGAALERWAPELGVGAWQLFTWGFLISTVALYHATFTINSLSHLFGSRRYDTDDTSRNNPLLALLTLGEGWHNNHHRFPGSARQGFRWWEYDVSFWLLRLLAAVGLVWDLRPVPERVLREEPR
jgi:stearoyl-CoA desaturase (delta-9 desaturase)